MKTLFLGEIVGKCGLSCIIQGLKETERDLTIANAEGLACGWGLTREGASLLMRNKIDVLAGGEKIFFKRDLIEMMQKSSRVIRPLNMNGKEVPGFGIRYQEANGEKTATINLIGQIGIRAYGTSNPFQTCDWALKKMAEQEIKTVFIFFHAQATSEKQALFKYLDGKVTAVIGTHAKAMTADAQVSEKGTAYISDNGRCGSFMSVGGLDPVIEIKKEKTGQVVYSKDFFDEPEIQGVMVTSENGKATSIEAVKRKITLTDKSDRKLEDPATSPSNP